MNFPLALRYGAILSLGIFVWQVASAATGQTGLFIPIATGLQAGVMIAMFSQPASGRPLGPRIATGAVVSAIGAVTAFAGSMLTTQVLFPDLLPSMGAVPPTAMAAAGGGFMGTFVTGTALSAALAFVQRNRLA